MEQMATEQFDMKDEILDFCRTVLKNPRCSYGDLRKHFTYIKIDPDTPVYSGYVVKRDKGVGGQIIDDAYTIISREQYGNVGRSGY